MKRYCTAGFNSYSQFSNFSIITITILTPKRMNLDRFGHKNTNAPTIMNNPMRYERRYTIANDEICLGQEDFGSLTSSSSSSDSISSVPTMNHDSAKPMSNDTQSQSPSPSLQTRWRIQNKDINEIPEIYPRLTYPLIFRDREVSEIGDRLWAFFKAHDVRSLYDPKQGRLLCGTQRVGFVLQFWRRRSSKNETFNNSESDEEIILEIQRRKGCSWAMQKIRSALKKSLLQQYQSSQSEPSLRHNRLSPTTKRSFFPPPPERFNRQKSLGTTIKPLLRLKLETGKQEPFTNGIPSLTSQKSLDESHRRRWEKPDLPPTVRSIPAIRDPFVLNFPPPLNKTFCVSTSATPSNRSY